jgi:hypothetical protein
MRKIEIGEQELGLFITFYLYHTGAREQENSLFFSHSKTQKGEKNVVGELFQVSGFKLKKKKIFLLGTLGFNLRT